MGGYSESKMAKKNAVWLNAVESKWKFFILKVSIKDYSFGPTFIKIDTGSSKMTLPKK